MIRAVLGGSFDPVHAGHVAMARHILTHRLAERVLVVPNWRSPDKAASVAAPEDRLAMVRLAFADEPNTRVDDREVRGGQPAYTVDTLLRLAADHPGDQLRLVVGADHVAGFSRWRDPERIQELAEVLVLARDGEAIGVADLVAGGLDPRRTLVETGFDQPVSSRQVRAMLSHDTVPPGWLAPAVIGYITAHGLYRSA